MKKKIFMSIWMEYHNLDFQTGIDHYLKRKTNLQVDWTKYREYLD